MKLECFVLGTSGSLPLPRRNLTSVLIRREGEEFLFDCGEGMQVSLKQMHVRWKNLKAICISHSHADHVTGLPGLLMLSAQVHRETPLIVICPLTVKHYLENTIKYLAMYINYPIEYIILDDIKDPLVYEGEDGSYNIKAFRGNHTRDLWFFILEESQRPGKFYPEKARELEIPEGSLWAELQRGLSIQVGARTIHPHEVLGTPRQGRKIAYVTDTRPSNTIVREIANSDMVFCESMFKHKHEEQALEKKHMTSREAAQMIRDAGGVKKAGLLHFSPRYSYRDIQELEQEAKEVFPHVFACQDRNKFEIPYQD